MTLDLRYLADWHATGAVCRDGMEMVRCISPREAFWQAWREARSSLKDMGISIEKIPGPDGGWCAMWHRGIQPDLPAPPRPAPVVAVIPPAVEQQLFPWQPPIVRSLAGSLVRNRAALDACGTGVGKTTASLAALRSVGLRHAVVLCPIGVMPNWTMWAERFGMTSTVVNYEIAVRKGIAGYLRRGPDGFAWETQVREPFGVVYDEGHRIGGIDTLASKVARQSSRQQIPTLVLSATIADSPLRMSALGEMLKLFGPGKFWDWAIKHGCAEGRFGWEFSGSSDATREIGRSIMLAGKGVKLMPRDIPGFPEANIQCITLRIQNPARVDRLIREIADLSRDRSERAKLKIIELKQIVELEKLPAAIEVVQDKFEEGNSTILFVHHRASAELAAKKLGCPLIIGGQDPRERRHIMERFQSNQERQLVATDGAGGEGINLHDLHGDYPRFSLYLPSGSSRLARQVVGRIWRAGAKSKANAWFGVAFGTLELDMMNRLAGRLNRIDSLTDRDFQPFESADASAIAELVERSTD